MIDLHTHSTFSDGSMTPEELLQQAKKEGVTVLALTDHDSVGGLDRFMPAAGNCGIKAVPGIEISVDGPKGSMHILGYFIDWKEKGFIERLDAIRRGRLTRNIEMIDALNQMGIDLTLNDIRQFAGEDTVGRLHFALALTAKGFVKNKEEAFNRFLADGKSAYVSREKLLYDEAIRMIRDVGAVAVLAHPCTLKMRDSDLEQLLTKMIKKGLQGLEVYYPEHSPSVTKRYEQLASAHGLIMTGGTDFHGAPMPDIKLGRGFGNLKVPEKILEDLESKYCRVTGKI